MGCKKWIWQISLGFALLFTQEDLKADSNIHKKVEDLMDEELPTYIYKILSKEAWEASSELGFVQLTSDDDAFIHFSKIDQLERIISKYWKDQSEFIVLAIDPKKLPGRLVFETNPGGSAKYYHLYNGSIPLEAVVDVSLQRHANK